MWIYYVVSIPPILILIYFIFFVPVNYKSKDSKDKRTAINRSRKLRKNGKNIPPPFPNGWFCLMGSNELEPGTAKDVNCLGENFVVFRSAVTKEVYVLDAYCTHMGANLGVGGIVKDECIECPFHQWKFSGKDGSLVSIPYSEDIKSVQKMAKMRKWISKEINKLIFVWYHAENEEPWDIPIVQEVENDKFWLHGTNDFIIYSHIQDIPENGADRAHLATVHGPNILAGTDIRTFRDKLLSIGLHLWDAKWNACEGKLKHIAKASIDHVVEVLKVKFFQLEADVTQIGPGYVVLKLKTFYGNVTILQTVTPIEPMKQRLMHFFYGTPWNGLFMKFTIFGETVNVARDAMVWDNKTFIRNPLLPKEEKQIRLYRNWFSQFYSENSKSFQEAYNDLSW
ncbi:hypothetical protein PVAND_012304 [Polypedilum vanderplanki]|uniref:cholesterol 7-desaturase n=1 Tax=Polypedilum vanderplanki TaxID=319348 RepID=A0A9J6CM12_POLVA|nr:hypothetical protein PVAND_012304 [Polypedilum vanderplanki]